MRNDYDSLKIDCLEDVEPVEATASWTITEPRSETITITTALLPDGFWVHGYTVYWCKGGSSIKKPTAALGKFRSQRDAELYAIGFMKMYLEYFTPETRYAIRIAEHSLSQTQLFN